MQSVLWRKRHGGVRRQRLTPVFHRTGEFRVGNVCCSVFFRGMSDPRSVDDSLVFNSCRRLLIWLGASPPGAAARRPPHGCAPSSLSVATDRRRPTSPPASHPDCACGLPSMKKSSRLTLRASSSSPGASPPRRRAPPGTTLMLRSGLASAAPTAARASRSRSPAVRLGPRPSQAHGNQAPRRSPRAARPPCVPRAGTGESRHAAPPGRAGTSGPSWRAQHLMQQLVLPHVCASGARRIGHAKHGADLVILEARREDIGRRIAIAVDDQHHGAVISLPDRVTAVPARSAERVRVDRPRLHTTPLRSDGNH